ncbi:hypothetical protein FQN49_007649 [Arthroderma sp. PD_2]|nr:hypothetical protein FQN49_007649 [Arthroderma sp. PD_2]
MVTYTNGDRSYVSEDFLIKTSDSQAPATKVHCRWSISEPIVNGTALRYFHSLDLLLSIHPTTSCRNDTEVRPYLPDATGTALEILVRRVCYTDEGLAKRTEVATKVLLALGDGYLCRSDILDVRMRHSEFVDAVISFCTWDRRLPAFSRHSKSTLLPLLLSSPGAILAKQTPSCHHENWKLLHKDLEMRLSFDWILPKKPAAYRVALVAGRHMYDPKRCTYRAQEFFGAAQALGIALTVLDEPGHWLESEKYAHLRDGFIAVDFSSAVELPQRIVESVRSRYFDGIVTFTDQYVVATAQAAEILGLPTEPVKALFQTHHKDEMRKVVNDTNIQALSLDSTDQLNDPAVVKSLMTLQYPLVVKPSYGRASAGVKKVTGESNMREAIRLLHEDGLAGDGIVIEQFVHGPEVDCNFVLWDGKVLFLEVTDDLPCAGDASDVTLADNFFETAMVSNSGLPPEEIQILRSSLHRSLLQLGLRWGVFHAEARMQNSSVRYHDVRGDGVLDLVRSTSNNAVASFLGRQPEAFLIEANVRPPGNGGPWSTLCAYGIDYNALQLLRAVEDRERFEALSKPFLFPEDAGGGGGAQYWSALCMIPVHRENIRVPDDFFEKLYQQLPKIASHVSKAELHARPGTIVSPTGGVGLLAYVVLYSRTSRRHILEMCYRTVDAAREILDDEKFC